MTVSGQRAPGWHWGDATRLAWSSRARWRRRRWADRAITAIVTLALVAANVPFWPATRAVAGPLADPVESDLLRFVGADRLYRGAGDGSTAVVGSTHGHGADTVGPIYSNIGCPVTLECVTDGNDLTRIAFGAADGQTVGPDELWLTGDLGPGATVDRVRFATEQGTTGPNGYAFASSDDDLTYTVRAFLPAAAITPTGAMFADGTPAVAGTVTLPSPVTARYWRITQLGHACTGCGFYLTSFELYGPVEPDGGSGPGDLLRGAPMGQLGRGAADGATAVVGSAHGHGTDNVGPTYSQLDCQTLTCTTDGNDLTDIGFGAAGGQTVGPDELWLTGDLMTAGSVSRVRFASPNAIGISATGYAIASSDDDVTYVVRAFMRPSGFALTGQVNRAGDHIVAQTATLPSAVSARYWRLTQLGHACTGCGLYVASFELYGSGPLTAPDAGSTALFAAGAQPSGVFSSDPVNLGTGSLTAHADDLTLPGRVLGFAFTRWYNSADNTAGGPLGPGWTHSFNWTLTDSTATVVVRRGDGRQDTFTKNPDGSYADPPGVFDTLVKHVDGSFTLTTPSQIQYELSSAGQLNRIHEPAGNQLSLAYATGSLASITDAVGRVVALSYNAQGLLAQLQDPLGRKVTYAYDGSGRLVTVTDPIGNGPGPAGAHQWHYGYDGPTRHISSIIDPDGRVRVTNSYDSQGRVTQQRDPLSALTTIAYSTGQTVLTDPRGHPTTYTFDSRMRVTAQADPVGATTYTLSYSYDAAGNWTSVTDRNGNRTDFSYDPRGNLLTKTDPSPDGIAPRPVTSFAYDARNNLTRLTDAMGFTTTYAYDSATNVLLSVTRQMDASTTATTRYESADPANPGLPTRITSPRGNTGPLPDPTYATTLAYDAQGNLVRRTDPDRAITTFGYDTVGRLTSFVDPDGNAPGAVPADHTWRVSYDALDREVSRADPLGNIITTAYDGAGNPTAVTDRNGNSTAYAYDANARLAATQQRPDPYATPSLIYTTAVARDASGNATRITQANAVATDYGFDALNRLASVSTHPSPTTTLTTSYTLDGNGQPTARTTGDGVTVSYQHDALSRLTAVAGPALSISYGYDPLGRRTRMTDATGSTTYSYDGLGRITSLTAPTGTLGYTYDLDSNRTRLAYSATDAVTYAYSPGGRMTTVTDWAARVSRYTYQPSGLVSGLSYPNGLAASYAYDRAQRLTGLSYSLHGVIGSEGYTLDAEGNRTTLTDLFGATAAIAGTLGYDGLNRLTAEERHLVATGTSISNEAFTLDPGSNIASRTGPTETFSYDGANRMTSDGTRTFVWDGADRLTTRGTDHFSYDPLSRLTATTVGGITLTYTYNGDGLLRSRTQGATTTTFMYDASVAPAPLLQAGTERLVYGLGPLYQVHPAGTYDTLLRDGLGSVRLTVSGTGAVTGAFDYTAYGARNTGSFGTSLLGFAGELGDPSGLIYLRARWYDPAIGRLITHDPIVGLVTRPDTLNAYSYASGNPALFTDPSGRFCIPCVGAIVGGVAGLAGYWASTKATGTSFQWDQAGIAAVAGAASGAACTVGVIAGCLAVSTAASVIQYQLAPGTKTTAGYVASAAFGVVAGRFTFTKSFGSTLSAAGYFAGDRVWAPRAASAVAGFIRSFAASLLADSVTGYAGADVAIAADLATGPAAAGGGTVK